MIVAAHPADSFDQAGGALAHHVAQGDSVTVVIATTGVRSHHWELASGSGRGRHAVRETLRGTLAGGSWGYAPARGARGGSRCCR